MRGHFLVEMEWDAALRFSKSQGTLILSTELVFDPRPKFSPEYFAAVGDLEQLQIEPNRSSEKFRETRRHFLLVSPCWQDRQ